MPGTEKPKIPRFDTAQYTPKTGSDVCQLCAHPIGASYYRVKGGMTCASCGEKAAASLPKDSHANFIRGMLFGVGGAILGLIIYSTFAIATGLIIGYASLAVGYIVAKAIKKGANGMGGQRYQIAAVALTYAAVSLSAIPIGISQYIKAQEKVKQAQEIKSQQRSGADELQTDPPARQNVRPHPPRPANFGSLAFRLLAMGIASPFLELRASPSAFIGLLILFIGLRIAWQLSGADPRDDVVGPFTNRAPSLDRPTSG